MNLSRGTIAPVFSISSSIPFTSMQERALNQSYCIIYKNFPLVHSVPLAQCDSPLAGILSAG